MLEHNFQDYKIIHSSISSGSGFYKIIFISNQMPENLSSLIKNRGYEIHSIRGYTHTESQIRNEKYKKSIQNDIRHSTKIINSYKNK